MRRQKKQEREKERNDYGDRKRRRKKKQVASQFRLVDICLSRPNRIVKTRPSIFTSSRIYIREERQLDISGSTSLLTDHVARIQAFSVGTGSQADLSSIVALLISLSLRLREFLGNLSNANHIYPSQNYIPDAMNSAHSTITNFLSFSFALRFSFLSRFIYDHVTFYTLTTLIIQEWNIDLI